MNKSLLTIAIFSLLTLRPALAQPLSITNIAGQFGNSGYQNGNGLGTLFLGYAETMAADPAGNVYVLDGYGVRRIAPNGDVSTFAGHAVTGGYFDTANLNALFDFEQVIGAGIGDNSDIAVDASGNVYIAETGNFDIRKISGGYVSTLAGSGSPGHADGTNTSAQFTEPHAIAVDSQGNVYVSDADFYPAGSRIRKITPAGVVTTIAGGTYGYSDGKGTNAQFAAASGLAVGRDGTIYVADGWGVRKISPFGLVTTWVGNPYGTGEEDLFGPFATFDGNAFKIALDGTGGAYVADGDTIRYIDRNANVSTVAGLAGSYATTNNDGVGSQARFGNAFAIASDAARNIYISDPTACTISKGVPPSLAPFGSDTLVSIDPGGSPIRSSNPWEFYAFYQDYVVGLTLRFQSTTTTNIESSWTDLPGNPYSKLTTQGWVLYTSDVPTGTRYFRVIASAPGYLDSASAPVGPVTVLNGFAPFGNFVPRTTSPYAAGKLWTFNISESASASGMAMTVQFSGDNLNWTNLPGGQMTSGSAGWTLTTTNVPLGKNWFRVLATAPNYAPLASSVAGPYVIGAPLPPVIQNNLSGNIALDKLIPTNTDWTASPAAKQVANLFVTNLNATLKSTLTVLGTELLSITNGQTVTVPGLNIGPGAGLVIKGAISGDVATVLNNNLTSAQISSLESLALQGGAVRYDNGTFSVASAGLTDSLSLMQVTIIAADLLSAAQAQSARPAKPGVVAFGHPQPQPRDNTQPTFIGQMVIAGNYSQFTGMLTIGIAGTNTLAGGAQQYDQLFVNGTAILSGTIAFAFFNPNSQSDPNVFQPTEGDTFDIVVASNIVLDAVQILGPVWGDGRSFSASLVTRADGFMALRLTAIDVAPVLHLQNVGNGCQVLYPTNFSGYSLQSASAVPSTNWTTISTSSNSISLNATNSSQFFRLIRN